MRFSTYLTENKNLKNEATLVLHKIISMVDNAHVDMNENDIRFAVGPMIHKGSYNGLKVVIRKGDKGVRLGKLRDGSGAVIVVGVDRLPERKGIDTLLSKTDYFEGFVTAFVQYLNKLHDHDADHDKHDAEVEVDNTENFEDNYNKIVAEFTAKNVETYKKAYEEATGQTVDNANLLKREIVKLSVKNLQKEYIGTNEAEFLSLVKKLPEYKAFERIDKSLSAKLDARLKTYFASHVKPLLK